MPRLFTTAPRRLVLLVVPVLLAALALPAALTDQAVAAPPAPTPTSTAASPEAPDPHPPLGGQAPDGSVPGGDRLTSRALVLPAGAPALPKDINAAGWVLADLDSGEILAARDPHGRYQPASILKTLTAVTVLPNLPGDREVTVSENAATAEGSAVGLLAGASYTVDQLFEALMLVSGNDAAMALAEANGGLAETVAAMNAKAVELGAYDTFVQTPSGLDGWQQLTSAYDMALVLQAVVHQPRLLRYDGLASASYPAKTSPHGTVGPYQFDNQSQNFMTTVPGAIFAKTGFTDAAQHTYLAAATRSGRTLGVVFLRDQRAPVDQFEQAHRLLDWGFALGPSVEPVGALTGPVRTDAAPQLAGSPDAAAASLAATVRGGGNRTPLTVAVSCVLVLGAAFFGRRRQVKRRMRRRRQAAAARVTARSAPLLAGRARPPRRPGGTS